jgi:Histidine kinase sensor domain
MAAAGSILREGVGKNASAADAIGIPPALCAKACHQSLCNPSTNATISRYIDPGAEVIASLVARRRQEWRGFPERMLMFRSPRLLLKLIHAMLVASVLVPVGAFGLFAWHSYHQTVHNAEDRAQRFATIVQEHTLTVFEIIRLVLGMADERLKGVSWDKISTSKEIWDELRKLEQSSEQIGSIFVVDRNGFGPLTTRAYPSPVVDFSDRDYYFEQRRADQGFYVGQAYTGKISNDPIFNFTIRKTSEDGNFDGVIGISAFVGYFESYYRSIGIPDDNFAIALVKDDGNILVRYPAAKTGSSKIPPDSPFIQNLSKSDRGAFFARSPFNGVDRLYGYEKVRGYPIYAVYGIEQRTITAEWFETISQAGAIAFIVGFCLFVTAWFALKRAKQEGLALQRLTQTTQRLEHEIAKREQAEASLMQA